MYAAMYDMHANVKKNTLDLLVNMDSKEYKCLNECAKQSLCILNAIRVRWTAYVHNQHSSIALQWMKPQHDMMKSVWLYLGD